MLGRFNEDIAAAGARHPLGRGRQAASTCSPAPARSAAASSRRPGNARAGFRPAGANDRGRRVLSKAASTCRPGTTKGPIASLPFSRRSGGRGTSAGWRGRPARRACPNSAPSRAPPRRPPTRLPRSPSRPAAEAVIWPAGWRSSRANVALGLGAARALGDRQHDDCRAAAGLAPAFEFLIDGAAPEAFCLRHRGIEGRSRPAPRRRQGVEERDLRFLHGRAPRHRPCRRPARDWAADAIRDGGRCVTMRRPAPRPSA